MRRFVHFGMLFMIALFTGSLSAAWAQTPGTIVTIAGTGGGEGSGGFSGDGGQASLAQLNNPTGVFVDTDGTIYIADTSNHRVRMIDSDGNISTIAGSGATGFGGGAFEGDGGPATAARLNGPQSVTKDASGNLYIADGSNNRVRRIDPAGNISTIAGSGATGFGAGAYMGDGGLAVSARLNFPRDVAVDGNDLYIVDELNHVIRKVDLVTGIITTVAGDGFGAGTFFGGRFGGDGGQATAASFNNPRGVAVHGGFLYIGDCFNHRIRRVDLSTGIITTIAGTGVSGATGDGGSAELAGVSAPTDVFVDGGGNLFIADTGAKKIRKVDAGTNIIDTVAGSGGSGYGGDGGPATEALLNTPRGIHIDSLGDLLIADTENHRIRKVFGVGIGGGPPPPPPNQAPVADAGDDQTVEASSPAGASVTLDASGSSDADGDGLTYTWTDASGNVIATGVSPTVILPIGTHTLTLTVDDGQGGVTTDTVVITVQDTTPPVIALIGDETITLTQGDSFTDPGATASDDVDPAPGVTTSGGVDTGTPGTYTITYTATDASGNSASVTRTVIVTAPPPPPEDTTPPVITLQPAGDLWPPDHRYVTFTVDQIVASVVDDLAGSIPVGEVRIVEASSDEPEDARGNGDGQTLNDIVIAPDGKSIQLRAERDGRGNGRVYTVTVAVRDPSGNEARASYKPSVPHSLGAQGAPVDDGPVYIVTAPGGGGPSAKVVSPSALPSSFWLEANWPNPFNPSTRIAYEVPVMAHVTLVVYNLLGQEIVRLVDEVKAPGRYQVVWDGRNAQGLGVASGVYLYRLTSGTGFAETKRMTLVK